jgi:hypothetical protein
MEVHHHSHTPRKKWTHYLWEFLMLFLAVTLGFFVENRREHYIEHQRAKVYAASMKANLQVDTNELIQIVRRGTHASAFLDTFLLLASTEEFSKIPTGKLYWYGLFGGYLRGFLPNDATYQQMKSSGSLRYFSDPVLEQKISDYDQLMRSMQISLEIDQPIYLEVRKLRSQMFDFRYNNAANNVVQRAVYEKYDQAVIDSFIQTNPPLLSNDMILFNQYAELCRSRGIRRHVINATQALELAAEIIGLLNEKFHLK